MNLVERLHKVDQEFGANPELEELCGQAAERIQELESLLARISELRVVAARYSGDELIVFAPRVLWEQMISTGAVTTARDSEW